MRRNANDPAASESTGALWPQDSQATLASLVQVEPTPIDADPDGLPGDPLDASASLKSDQSTSSLKSHPPSASAVGLSGSGHGAVFYLMRIQRYSSYAFTLFAGIHMTDTSLIPLLYQSVPYSEPFLLMARELYQTSVAEPLLVGLPIVAHVASGFALRFIRRRQNLQRYGADASRQRSAAGLRSGWPTLSYISISGYIFTGLCAGHVVVNRALPIIVDGDSSNIGLQYVAHGFSRHPLQAWAFFVSFLSIGVGHMVWGWTKWLNRAPPPGWRRSTVDKDLRKRRSRAWWSTQAVALVIGGLWAAGSLGIVATHGRADGWLATVYDRIYESAGQ